MSMMTRWTKEMVDAHNQRVACSRMPQSQASAQPLPVVPTGVSTDEANLNKTERAWLARLRATGIEPYIQAITLKLGHDCRYLPDFAFVDPTGRLTFWEVKGFMRDDARVKLHVAARVFPRWRFVLVRRIKGQFESEVVKP